MTIQLSTQPLAELTTDALLLPLLADVEVERMRGLDPWLVEVVGTFLRQGDWRGDIGETATIYPTDISSKLKQIDGIKRIVLIGMDKQAGWTYEKMRLATATGINLAATKGWQTIALLLPEQVTSATAKDLATIAQMATYRFSYYKTLTETDKDKSSSPKLASLIFVLTSKVTSKEEQRFLEAIRQGLVIGESVNEIRDLVNHPANVVTPTYLAKVAQQLADHPETTVTVFDRTEAEKLGFGGFLAVAKGSVQEPQFIVIDYHPKAAGAKAAPIALVGKGITFDSGGISIKPADNMDTMKMDMAGAAACLGVIRAVQALVLPLRIVAVLPTTENLPSGSATKPGDIATAFDGKTIEILNTDAEGRLVLADGISYVGKTYHPQAIIDIATLTGAALVLLGHHGAPILGTSPELVKKLELASQRTGERVWEMPLWDEFKEMVKSEIADVKNLGEKGKGGMISGAAFLSYFVPDGIPWVHIDIAGTGMLDKPRPYHPKPGSGWGVRLLVDLLEHWDD